MDGLREALQRTKARITDISRWTQGNYGKIDNIGLPLSLLLTNKDYREKCAVCVSAALALATADIPNGHDIRMAADDLLISCGRKMFPGDTFENLHAAVQINDGWRAKDDPAKAHANTLAMIDCAIECATEKAPVPEPV